MKAIIEDLRKLCGCKKPLTFGDLEDGEWYELDDGTKAGARMKIGPESFVAVEGDVRNSCSGEIVEMGRWGSTTAKKSSLVRRLKVKVVIQEEE